MGFGLASLWVLWGWGIFVCVLQLPQNDLPSTGSWGRQNPLPRAGWGAQLWGRAWLRPALHANKSKTIYIIRWPHPPSLSYKLWACAQDIFFVYEMMVSRRKKKGDGDNTYLYRDRFMFPWVYCTFCLSVPLSMLLARESLTSAAGAGLWQGELWKERGAEIL